MKVTFVAHASILVEALDRTILSDPWYTGKVFNNGWALLSEPHPVAFADVDYIWISHEHPDHFNFATLKQVSDADKHRICVLYQQHASPRIIDAIRKLGFARTQELPLYEWFELKPGLHVLCGSSGKIDSFLAIRDNQGCVLNLNDCCCNPHQLRYIKRLVGDVTVLFAQFSFANWVGNDRDECGAAALKIGDLEEFTRVFEPRRLVPFASFVYFCNAENERMNAWVNTPALLQSQHLPRLSFMYPGDEISLEAPVFNSQAAVDRYTRDYERLSIDPTPPPVDADSLREVIQGRLRTMHAEVAHQPLLQAYLLAAGNRLASMPAFQILVHDLDCILVVDPARATCDVLDRTPEPAERARYVMCSQVAWYTFAFVWGSNTTEVSGMYLDREYSLRGQHPFFAVQGAISSESLTLPNRDAWRRLAVFWWRKRSEVLYRLTWATSVRRWRRAAEVRT